MKSYRSLNQENELEKLNGMALVLQEEPHLEIPKRATRSREAASRVEGPSEKRDSRAGALVVLVCGPSESTFRWTRWQLPTPLNVSLLIPLNGKLRFTPQKTNKQKQKQNQ